MELREHILYECPLWIRKHSPSGPGGAQCIGVRDIVEFLRLIPSVGTFERLDLVHNGLACIVDGCPRELACHRVEAHSQ
jgi:hypothetical protein